MGEAEGEALDRLMAEHDRLSHEIEDLGGWDTERKVETVLSSEIGATTAMLAAGYNVDSLMVRYQVRGARYHQG